MPAKRRQRGKVRAKGTRAKELSSEDMDSQDQLNEITNRLAKKQLKSSTDTEVEHQDHKENHGKRLGGDGYDADFETSEFDTTSAGSDMDCQTQPSKPSDFFRGVLSPSQGSSGKRKGNTQGSLQKQVVMRQSRQAPTRNSIRSSRSSQSQQSNQTQGRRQSRRKTHSTDSSDPSRYSSMASSSLLKSPEMMFSLPNGSDSSTPLSGVVDSKSEANDSCFGFEVLLSPPQQQPLPFSPVLPESPSYVADSLASSPPLGHRKEVEEDVQDTPPSPSPSDNLVLRLSPSPQRAVPESSSMYSSMDSKSYTTSRGSQKRKVDVKLMGLIHKEDEKVPPKKTVKRRKTQKKKEEDAWTMKMSTEFDDIDMFELTVE